MTVVDVGAHIGYYTRLFSRLVGPTGRVLSFEVDPDNYQLLELNTLHHKNVKMFPVALADRVGDIDFYESTEKSGCHSTVLGAVASQKKRTVPVSDLDTILTKEGMKVDIVKIDIEGGEPVAIKGMSRVLQSNPNLVLITEVSARRLNLAGTPASAYLRMLHSFGFLSFLIQPERLVPVDVLSKEVDAMFHTHDPINVLCSRKEIKI